MMRLVSSGGLDYRFFFTNSRVRAGEGVRGLGLTRVSAVFDVELSSESAD